MSISIKLRQLIESNNHHQVRSLDIQFAEFIRTLDTVTEQLEVAAYLLSCELGKGNVCLDFNQPHELMSQDYLHVIQQSISGSSAVQKITENDNLLSTIRDRPLVLEGNRLYLQRLWAYETQLNQYLHNNMKIMPWNIESKSALFSELFVIPEKSNNSDSNKELDWQCIAAILAAQNKFSVISGGPGTGKTTTVIRILAILCSLYKTHFKREPTIHLAAPTGKAAMRLSESIKGAKKLLNVSDELKSSIPEDASTLHRLLNQNKRGEFKYNAQNPLHLDILIVDEASMVDLPLMAKLVSAMPEMAQLILLGDKDQLASVEAGSVLADICDSNNEHGYGNLVLTPIEKIIGQKLPSTYHEIQGAPLRNSLAQLRKSYRFDASSGIGFLARAANSGSYKAWQEVLAREFDDIHVDELSDDSMSQFIDMVVDEYSHYLKAIEDSGNTDEQVIKIHHLFNQFKVLCAVREGDTGVSGLNDQIERALAKKGKINKESQWYCGRPVMVLENDYGLNLFNGDIGVLLPVCVAGVKGKESSVIIKTSFVTADGGIRWVKPGRLPNHETVYAMTVHKSQGSEFEHCALVFPDIMVPVLTKELIYTGITRAKLRLTCIVRTSVLKQALSKKVQRASGLRHRLWSSKSEDSPNSEQISESNQLSLF